MSESQGEDFLFVLDEWKKKVERYEEALQLISEMPCVEDNCASCYAKKVLEGVE